MPEVKQPMMIRVGAELKRAIRRAAKRADVGMSEWVRQAIAEKLRREARKA